jgi:hypothetical protein
LAAPFVPSRKEGKLMARQFTYDFIVDVPMIENQWDEMAGIATERGD